MFRRAAVAVTSSVAALGLVLLSAGPASAAATLPDGDQLYVIGDNQLWTSTQDGALTLVGAFASTGGGIYGADWDPTSGLAYFFRDGAPCQLYSLDIVTAVDTLIGTLEASNCDGLDVDVNGVLRVLSGSGQLYTVDKTDASTISDVNVTADSEQLSFLASTTTAQFTTGDYSTELFSLDVTTGATTPIGDIDYVESADYDSTNQLWISGEGDTCQVGLSSMRQPGDGTTYGFEGDFIYEANCVNAFAIFVTGNFAPPAPVLPATGPGAVVPLAAIAGLAVLAGVTVLIRARRTA